MFVDVLYTDRPFPFCVVKIICTLQLRLRQREKRFLETRKLSSFISASGNTDFSVLETVSELRSYLIKRNNLFQMLLDNLRVSRIPLSKEFFGNYAVGIFS